MSTTKRERSQPRTIEVTYTQDGAGWVGGHMGRFGVRNTGAAPLTGPWVLTCDLADGVTAGASIWGPGEGTGGVNVTGAVSQSGRALTITVQTPTLPPGASAQVQGQMDYPAGAWSPPENIQINGEGGVEPTEPPAVPTNLRVTGYTSSSVSLAWDPPRPADGVLEHVVYCLTDPSKEALLPGNATTATVTGLEPEITYQFAVASRNAVGVSDRSPSVEQTTREETAPPAPGTLFRFPPYVDMTLSIQPNGRKTLPEYRDAYGIRRFSLGFINNQGSTPNPVWGTSIPLDRYAEEIRAVGAENVTISFGGEYAEQHEIAIACATADQALEAYRRVVETFDLRQIDLDIEMGAANDREASRRRGEAIARLQHERNEAGKPLTVTLTLASSPDGLETPGRNVLEDTLAGGEQGGGITLSAINIMAMVFGPWYYNNYDSDTGNLVVRGTTRLNDQLKEVYGSSADQWDKIAITTMIGQNATADPRQVLTPAHAEHVLQFALEKQVGVLSFWSVTRDKPGPLGQVSYGHSGLDAPAGTFTGIFGRYDPS